MPIYALPNKDVQLAPGSNGLLPIFRQDINRLGLAKRGVLEIYSYNTLAQVVIVPDEIDPRCHYVFGTGLCLACYAETPRYPQ
jgi:hypothetical protein